MLRIVVPGTESQIDEVRELFAEYWRWLRFDPCFDDFDSELAALPGIYGPPDGCLLLACDDSSPVGCVAFRRIEDGVCEMKRLFVRPSHRGRRVGIALAQRIIEEARRRGYRRMRLDTLPLMTSAIALYESLGFVYITNYRRNPPPGAKFMELNLEEEK